MTETSGKMTPGFDVEYAALTAELPPRPIRDADHARTVEERVSALVALPTLSDAQRDYLDLLTDELEAWESAHDQIPDVSGVELVRFLLDANGLRQKDLTQIFGTESVASEVLSGRRELQRKHIEALSDYFHVSPSAFFGRSVATPAAVHDSQHRLVAIPDAEAGARSRSSHGDVISILVDKWATSAVDYARTLSPVLVTVVDDVLSAKDKAKSSRAESAVLFTVKTASTSALRLTEMGRMVFLASKEFGATTQTKLFEKVSIFLMGQLSAAGLPSHEKIVVDRDHIRIEHFDSGSRLHAQTIQFALET